MNGDCAAKPHSTPIADSGNKETLLFFGFSSTVLGHLPERHGAKEAGSFFLRILIRD